MLGANFIIKALAWIFIAAFDTVAYFLLAGAYSIFLAVSELDIFSTEAGGTIYNEICSRFYSALSIIMVFIFAYMLLNLIVDPEGEYKKASSQMLKDVIISIIAVIVLPTVFGYMSLFQKHVLTNNTIGALILGANGTNDDNPGKQISMIVYTAFFHPEGTMYSDYFGDDGKLIGRDEAISVCKGPHDIGDRDENGNVVEVSTDEEVCTAWVDALSSWENSTNSGINAITWNSKLRGAVGDDGGMEYLWVLSLAAALGVAYFFFSYTLDVGTRAVKLGFLQIIAPIPVMLRPFKAQRKVYETWFAEIKKCYLEIFFRIAVIFFIVKLCTIVPSFIDLLFGANSSVEGGFLLKAIATVCLILGLLKFAKEAPNLIKTIFASAGGGLLAGVDLKPGVKRRISENEYAMKGISTATGALGGAIGTVKMAYNRNLEQSNVQGNDDWAARGGAAIRALSQLPRGVVSGGRRGFENTPQEFGARNIGASFNQGVSGGQSSYVNHENNRVFNLREAQEAAGDRGIRGTIGELVNQGIERGFNPRAEDLKKAVTNEYNLISGTSGNSQAALNTINKVSNMIDSVVNLSSSSTKPYDEAFEGLRKKMLSGETVTYGGKTYTASGGFDQSRYEEVCRKAGKAMTDSNGHYYNPVSKQYESSYRPESQYTTKSLSDLKAIFDKQKNQVAAKELNDKYQKGMATYAATIRDQLSKEMGNLGSATMAELDGAIKGIFGDGENLDSFLKKLSNENNVLTENDVKALKKVKGTLDQTGKNINIQTQIQQQTQAQRSPKPEGGKGGKKDS